MSQSVADYTATELRSIDEIDAAIGRLVRHMNTECYQMLVLVRELDDRFGWKQWGYKTCAEWLAWRSEIGLSAAREQVRTAHALRSLPAISAAFAEGRLTYTKVRALTRVADLRQEDLLLAYALERSLLLSDEPVIEKMKGRLTADGYRFDSLVETIVASPQFLNKRNTEITQNKRSTESTPKRGE